MRRGAQFFRKRHEIARVVFSRTDSVTLVDQEAEIVGRPVRHQMIINKPAWCFLIGFIRCEREYHY